MLKGLTVHRARNEEDALNLLFIGDTNRVVCETPMNDASTRSHCIFIIQIEKGSPDSDIRTTSKIHLVDLSGSERVGKTGVTGKLMKEACAINLSLSHLEHVINCLQKRSMLESKGGDPESIFVPYRDCMLTTVLRDSLGGNCMTRMITTVHSEDPSLHESISTCRFAMRVAMIKNTLLRNERMDPASIIARLKRENEDLKSQLAHYKSGNEKEFLTEEDKERCDDYVSEYINSSDPSANLNIPDRLMTLHCFKLMKGMILAKGAPAQTKVKAIADKSGLSEEQKKQYEDDLMKLRMLLQQRENEIMILLNMINKKGGTKGNPDILENQSSMQPRGPILLREEQKELTFPKYNKLEEDQNYAISHVAMDDNGEEAHQIGNSQVSEQNHVTKLSNTAKEIDKLLKEPIHVTKEQLKDRVECFERFRRSYRKNEAFNDNLELLRSLHKQGRELTTVVNYPNL